MTFGLNASSAVSVRFDRPRPVVCPAAKPNYRLSQKSENLAIMSVRLNYVTDEATLLDLDQEQEPERSPSSSPTPETPETPKTPPLSPDVLEKVKPYMRGPSKRSPLPAPHRAWFTYYVKRCVSKTY